MEYTGLGNTANFRVTSFKQIPVGPYSAERGHAVLRFVPGLCQECCAGRSNGLFRSADDMPLFA